MPLRIANAQAFWGDRNEAASELLDRVPHLDYLTMDYLAEVSMSILAQQRERDPDEGYPRDFLEVFKSLIPYWKSGGQCKLITNAGGLNPAACAAACAAQLVKQDCPPLKIAIVTGDDVLDLLMDAGDPNAVHQFQHGESGSSLETVRQRLVTANAYLGAAPIVTALNGGARIVITGRVADPSLTVAACVYHFGWNETDWDRWAGATVAGHLIECGVQATGGISTDWMSIPHPANLGFPIIEMEPDGTFVLTKPEGTGGRVTVNTVTEQLLYEIGDPGRYLSPDLTVSFLNLQLEQLGPDRVRVAGAKGTSPSTSYKVSATYRDGFRVAGQLTIFGRHAVRKARRCGELILDRMRYAGWKWRDSRIECLGADACADGVFPAKDHESLREVVLRVAMEADERDVLDFFSRQIVPLVTSGPQGTTGYAEGRPRVHSIFRYWPCLIDRHRVVPKVDFLVSGAGEAASKTISPASPPPILKDKPAENLAGVTTARDIADAEFLSETASSGSGTLEEIAIARSGDKGTTANIGVICRHPIDYDELRRWLTVERVTAYLSPMNIDRVERFELRNLHSLNFLVHGILSSGLRCDAQGKALGQVLLQMPLREFRSSGGKRER